MTSVDEHLPISISSSDLPPEPHMHITYLVPGQLTLEMFHTYFKFDHGILPLLVLLGTASRLSTRLPYFETWEQA